MIQRLLALLMVNANTAAFLLGFIAFCVGLWHLHPAAAGLGGGGLLMGLGLYPYLRRTDS